MRLIRMTAKKAGTCTNCHGPIHPGQRILWARGVGAAHVDCTTAKYLESQCSCCNGSGRRWNGVDCGACDGTGSKRVQDFAQSGGHPAPDPTDLAYEDDCARRCGL